MPLGCDPLPGGCYATCVNERIDQSGHGRTVTFTCFPGPSGDTQGRLISACQSITCGEWLGGEPHEAVFWVNSCIRDEPTCRSCLTGNFISDLDERYGTCCVFAVRESGITFSNTFSTGSTSSWCSCADPPTGFNTDIQGFIKNFIPAEVSDFIPGLDNPCIPGGACCDTLTHTCRNVSAAYRCHWEQGEVFRPDKRCGDTETDGRPLCSERSTDPLCCLCGTCLEGVPEEDCVLRGGHLHPVGPTSCANVSCSQTECLLSAFMPAPFHEFAVTPDDELTPSPNRVYPLSETEIDSGDGECRPRFGYVGFRNRHVFAEMCNDRGPDSLCRSISECPVIQHEDRVAFECSFRGKDE